MVLLFVPNAVMSVVGVAADVVALLFLVAQAILVIDLAYSWNTEWYSAALAAGRGGRGAKGQQTWQVAIISASALLCLGAAGAYAGLIVAFSSAAGRAVASSALAVSLALLVLGITDWCEHGSLLTSAAMAAYAMWLAALALVRLPLDLGGSVPWWLRVAELVACAASLAVLTQRRKGLTSGEGGEDRASSSSASGDSETGSGDTEPDAPGSPAGFELQLAVHAASAAYVASALAPNPSWLAFSLRTAALAASLLLYGWSLLAPKLLPGRSFG